MGFVHPQWKVFTVRYGLSTYIKQIRLVFKGLTSALYGMSKKLQTWPFCPWGNVECINLQGVYKYILWYIKQKDFKIKTGYCKDIYVLNNVLIQGDQKFFVHLTITVQKHAKIFITV
jgi:hypothetical protein